MNEMNKNANVLKQYSDDKNLSIRTNLHSNYSTNKKGLFPWLFEQYRFDKNYRILEIGCGNGEQWNGRIENLPEGCELILSDLSDGMVKIVKEKYEKHSNVSFEQIDIQNIKYPDATFDAVIANHMLYHVPDLPKALYEVNRILKKGCKFYCTTNGNGGMRSFLLESIKAVDPHSESAIQEFSFNLQNGIQILKKHFNEVIRIDYEDSLKITNSQDLIDWMKSTASISAYSEIDCDKLLDYFETIRKDKGCINIPKECGLFISVK